MAFASVRLGHFFMRGGACHPSSSHCELIRNNSSATGVESVDLADDKACRDIQPFFYNRNPRNLEKMTIARKPRGYALDSKNIEFWHKLVLKISSRHISAHIVHHTGVDVISASTSEYGFKKNLYRYADICAYKALGQVIAQRCLESGIDCVNFEMETAEGTKVHAFVKEVENSGLAITEPPVYKKPGLYANKRPLPPWQVTD